MTNFHFFLTFNKTLSIIIIKTIYNLSTELCSTEDLEVPMPSPESPEYRKPESEEVEDDDDDEEQQNNEEEKRDKEEQNGEKTKEEL
jgi:hypothetical protein